MEPNDYQKLQDLGRGACEGICEMVDALECDYQRLEELREMVEADKAGGGEGLLDTDEAEELKALEGAAGDCESREDAEQRIQEDPLTIEMSGTWPVGMDPLKDSTSLRAIILLGTGGPAIRIICELDQHNEPSKAWIEAQDWFQPWTKYEGATSEQKEKLVTYCRQFYFGG